MTDTLAVTPAAPAPNTVLETEYPNLPGKRTMDCTVIPADVRLDFLKGAVRAYIANRLNSLQTRYQKDPNVVAWNAFKEASKADPLQTVVPRPNVSEPEIPNFAEAYERAVKDLTEGKVRRQSDEPKAPKKTRDPLTAVITDAVIREVYDARKATDNKYTYIMARAEVGPDGLAYLDKMIAIKVAAGADEAQLQKMKETRYVQPCKMMLGLTVNKAAQGLPSIL
jgi:hypothetical protein